MIKLCLFNDKICQDCTKFEAVQTTNIMYADNKSLMAQHDIRCKDEDIGGGE